MKNKQKRTKLATALFVGVGVIAFWRGTWGLLDMYLFPNNDFLSVVSSVAIGFVILLITHNFVHEFLE